MLLLSSSGGGFLLASFFASAIYISWALTYNAFFHPLRRYPGPKLWALSRLPYAYACVTGHGHLKLLALHKKYGDIVRVAPDELSFSSPDAWKEIYGRRKNANGEFGKDGIHYAEALDSLLGAPKDKHTRFRRILSRGFSNQAMLDQEFLLKSHIDLLFEKLHSHCINKDSKPIDMAEWFDFVALDIITDLSFGESFRCLKSGRYHPWAQLFIDALKGMAFAMAIKRFTLLHQLLNLLAPKSLMQKYEENVEFTNQMVRRRLSEADRPDFVRAMAQKEGSEALTLQEIQANAQVLTMAGYDTTATALAGATYLLASHPDVMANLVQEVRSTFKTEAEISILGAQNMPYMTAVIDEAMRVYPPAASGAPRQVPSGGDTIFGKYVPGGTVLTLWQWPMYHNPANFSQPDAFVPERWLGDERFAADHKEAFQPFSYGARNCIGRNLAYAELRVIWSRLLWNFELELAPGTEKWMDEQPLYLLWKKTPLNIKLRRRG